MWSNEGGSRGLIKTGSLALAMVVGMAGCATAGAQSSAKALPASALPGGASVIQLQRDASDFTPDPISIAVHFPPGYNPAGDADYPVLYLNDGQYSASVELEATLARLYADRAIERLIVVAIDMPADRMGAYGLSDRRAGRSVVGDSRFGPVGSQAHAYSEWVATDLVPYIDAHYRTRATPSGRTVLGWSLGALNAFNLGWQYPDVFGQVGAFSPSFWLASDRTDVATAHRTRLAQGMVEHDARRDGLRIWLAVGTAEETDDRDNDGIIDAVGDTLDIASALRRRGYSVNPAYAQQPSANEDVALYLLQDGQHNQASWAKMLPLFLQWAYPETSSRL